MPKAASKPASGSAIDGDLVRELAGLLEETGLSEIEYGRDGWHIRVARGGIAYAAPAGAVPAGAVPGAAPTADTVDASHPGTLTSPMVGVVYTAPEEGAAPFVKVGDEVASGQTLLLIEAMKVFNPIVAPRGGRIARVLVSTGMPVEYGEPLLIIE